MRARRQWSIAAGLVLEQDPWAVVRALHTELVVRLNSSRYASQVVVYCSAYEVPACTVKVQAAQDGLPMLAHPISVLAALA